MSIVNQLHSYWLLIIFILITYFLIVSLIYDHYQRGYVFTSRSSNETVFIERALKTIPTCNPEDRARQRSLLYTFRTWNRLANAHHLQYWIAHKTLAGYDQHNGLSPYDNDIDVCIMYENMRQLFDLKSKNESLLYELEIPPERFTTKNFKNTDSRSESTDFTIQNTRFINQKDNASITIWPIYKQYSSEHMLLVFEYPNSNNWILSPIEWIFPLEPCVFSGIKTWCPSQPKRLINSMHETMSTHVTCINGSWVRLNQ